jgi:outer membrane receptor protein involved in Fe transport
MRLKPCCYKLFAWLRASALVFLSMFCSLSLHAQTVQGIVRDQSGNAVPFANVKLDDSQHITYTRSDGSYILRKVPAGIYIITISHVGFHPINRQIEVTGSGVYIIDFEAYADTVNIQTVVVRAGWSEDFDQAKLPSRTKLIESVELQNIPAVSTGNILSSVSGVHVNSESGIFSSSTVSLRGIGGNTQTGTLVIVDGIPMNKSDGGSVNWNIIDQDMIDKVEVIKGPVSALYGSNAMGGVIHIVTKKPTGKLCGNVSASYGTYQTVDGKVHLSGNSKRSRFFWRTFLLHRTSDGYIHTPAEMILENDSIVVPVFLNELFVGGLFGGHLSKGSRLEGSVNYFKDIRGRGTKVYEEVGSNTSRDTYQATLKYHTFLDGWILNSVGYVLRENYFRLNEYFSDGEYKLYEVDATRDDAGLRGTAERRLGSGGVVTGGLEARFGRVDAIDIYYTSTDLISNSGSIDVYAGFFQFRQQLKQGKFDLVAGLRFDAARFHDAAFAIEKPSYSIMYLTDFGFDHVKNKFWSSLSPKLTLKYQKGQATTLYISVAKGFRAPVLDDLCRTERGSQGLRVANPNLKPEHVYNFEIGSDFKIFRKAILEMSAYTALGRNFMHLLSTGDSVNLGYTIAPVYQMANISNVQVIGFEADLELLIRKSMKVTTSYTFNQGVIKNFIPNSAADPDLTGKFLSNLPAHRIYLGVHFETKYVDLSTAYKFTGARWIRDDNGFDPVYMLAEKYKPYGTFDLLCKKRFSNLAVSMLIDNVFGIVYVNHKGYKSPGRMFIVKAAYQLNKNTKG